MDLSIITKSYRQLGRAITKNSPTILTALGAAGVVATVILAIKATPKALEVLEMEDRFREEEWKNNRDSGDPRTTLETIELTWKLYIPTATMGLTTIACIIGANHISMRRNAALASLFTITETALKEYQAKVVEQIGEKKAEKIQSEIAQDHLDNNQTTQQSIIITGGGDYLVFDQFSSRYFRTNIDKVQRAANTYNQKLLREGWLSINYFYDELGLEEVELYQEYGWIAERGLLDIKTYSKVATIEGKQEPCMVIDYHVTPNHI